MKERKRILALPRLADTLPQNGRYNLHMTQQTVEAVYAGDAHFAAVDGLQLV